tara:strand:+ start:836 stop:1054 length:219 start_codon:yes stop_codon:yes gene_type:complete
MLGKGIRKINMKTQLLFNGWWAHYHPDCWFKNSEDTQYLENGVLVGFRPEEEGLTMKEAYERSKKEQNKKHI